MKPKIVCMKRNSSSPPSHPLLIHLKPPPARQPSPPCSPMDGLTDSTAKINAEGGDDVNSVIDLPKNPVKVKNGRSRPYSSRRCKRLNLLNSNIDSLPDELVYEILLRIPAQDIYCAVWPVCLKWYQMIRTREFVNTHLHRSTYGLLIQNPEPPKTRLTFMELSRQGRIELTRLNYEPGYNLWGSSCNGLILESKCRNQYALYITNPVTMQHFSIPPSSLPLFGKGVFYSALAYAPLSMEYKVVGVYRFERQWCCAIFIAGVDESWRSVHTQHLSLEAKELLQFRPLTTEGFVHWARLGNYVLSLNMETEIITEYPIPSSCPGHGFRSNHYYFSTVKYLSLLITCYWEWSWEVWEMKPETGEWTKLPRIELKDLKCEILGWLCKRGYSDSWWLVPVGWLEYKEVLVYRVQGPTPEGPSICIAWNIRLKKLEFIELDSYQNAFFVHRNSLVWLDGCT